MKTLSIVQARTGSTRLPDKVLKILHGKPMLEHIIDFLRHSKKTDEIIVATTKLKEDDEIITLCNQIGIKYFRDDPYDVLQRYYNCAKSFDGDIIVRITGDNPLIDPRFVDLAISLCMASKYDYVTNMINQTFPLGYLVEVFTFQTLEQLHLQEKDPESREHVTQHLRQNPEMYYVKQFFAPEGMVRPNWRLTVDNDEDFKLMEKIFKELYRPNQYIKYEDVVQFLDKNIEIVRLNED